MKRRDFLKVSGGLSAHVIVGGSLLSIHKAEAETGLPIAALQAPLDPKKDMVLVPGDKDFHSIRHFVQHANANRATRAGGRRKRQSPVSTTILWAADNGIELRRPLGRSLL